jgi:ABC-2 type transport system permease protein
MAILTLVGGPAAVGLLVFLAVMSRKAPGGPGGLWPSVAMGLSQFWAYFFLFPLSVIAFAAFYAQIEHRARAWDHLLALPVPKWRLFAIKALVVTGATALMHVLLVVFLLAGAALGGLVSHAGPLAGRPDLGLIIRTLAAAEGGSLMMIAAQLWISLRVASFAAPIMAGIGAFVFTLGASVFQRANDLRLFPWAVPTAMARAASPLKEELLAYGIVGGIVVFALMIWDLSRREMR